VQDIAEVSKNPKVGMALHVINTTKLKKQTLWVVINLIQGLFYFFTQELHEELVEIKEEIIMGRMSLKTWCRKVCSWQSTVCLRQAVPAVESQPHP
jgi:hypothetical protein